MKSIKSLLNLSLIVALIMPAVLMTSCNKDQLRKKDGDSILPTSFRVKIPSSMTEDSKNKREGTYKTDVDTLQGNEIYQHLGSFIAIGEGASVIVEAIIFSIVVHDIDEPMSLSFTGDDDGRTKNLTVIENVNFEGSDYEFQLTITDAASESNADGGNAIQVFWDRSPVRGVAILKPYNINRKGDSNIPDAMFRIDYSEAGNLGYDEHMFVAISGLPLASPLDDPYSVDAMKMFVGRSGNNVDVIGNTNHPNAKFFTEKTGFNWAFVASGKDEENIAVAEVGLPPSTLDETKRSVLLEDYSIKNVFTDEIYTAWPDIAPEDVDGYLHNTGAPGYFSDQGFVVGGTSPGSEYDELELRISSLVPYNPKDMSTLELTFK